MTEKHSRGKRINKKNWGYKIIVTLYYGIFEKSINMLFQKQIYLKGGDMFIILFEAIIYLPLLMEYKYSVLSKSNITLIYCSPYVYI